MHEIVGHIGFSSVTIKSGADRFEAVCLAPMAILPAYQKRGTGSQLVREGLKRCLFHGHQVVMVLGHPDYYPRFGFRPAKPVGIECEYEVPDEVWMIVELKEGALAGRRGTVFSRPEFKEVD